MPVEPIDPGGVGGDPIVKTLDGGTFKFHGIVGETYSLLQADGLLVTMRLAGCPADEDLSYVDRLEILDNLHRVVMILPGAQLDGEEFHQHEHPHHADSMSLRHWVGHGGERRVDVVRGDWRLALLHDFGTNHDMHGAGPLWEVEHLALFVDGHPEDLSAVSGLLIDGVEGCDPDDYLVTGS